MFLSTLLQRLETSPSREDALQQATRQIQEWLSVAESRLEPNLSAGSGSPKVSYDVDESGWTCRLRLKDALLEFRNPVDPGLSPSDKEGLAAFATLLQHLLDSRRLSGELFHLEEQVRALMDTSLHLLALVAPDGRVERLNPRDSETAIGQKLWDASWLDDRYRKAVREAVERAVEEMVTSKLEVETDRSQFYELSLSPITDDRGRVSFLVAEGRDPTERQRVREVLLEEREFLRAVLDCIEDAILVFDSDYQVTLVNSAATRLLGLEKGQSVQEQLEVVEPAGELSLLDVVLQGEPVEELEVALRGGDGPVRYFNASGRRLYDTEGESFGAVLALNHFTRRRQAERALAESERQFRALFNSQPNAVLTVTFEGKIVRCNPVVQELFGYQVDELTNLPVKQLLAPSQAIEQNGTGEGEFFYIRRDGSTFLGATTRVAVRESDEELGFMWLVTDISAQRKAQKELAAINRKLAQGKEMERSRLARELHDGAVQNLLAVSYRMKNDPLKEEVLEVVQQLRVLISDLRPPGLQEFGLVAALEGHVAKLERQSEGNFPLVRLVSELSTDIPDDIAVCLFRVAQEALTNALKHSKAQSVKISVREAPDGFVLRVFDDGVGFEPPTDIRTLVSSDHFGLAGLAERVELVRGELEIASTPGRGTIIAVTVPYQRLPN